MPKRLRSPAVGATPFSIARQFTGPPFSQTLQDTALRIHLMEELAQTETANADQPPPKASPAPGRNKPAKKATERRPARPKTGK